MHISTLFFLRKIIVHTFILPRVEDFFVPPFFLFFLILIIFYAKISCKNLIFLISKHSRTQLFYTV